MPVSHLLHPVPTIAPAGEPCPAPWNVDGCLWDRFAQVAAHAPDAEAVRCETGAVSWRELVARANDVACLLRERGVRRGDVVGFLLPPEVSFFACLMGILRCGAIALPLDARSPADRVRRVVDHGGARVAFADAETVARLREAAPACDVVDFADVPSASGDFGPSPAQHGDIAGLLYTSGSTGGPKGASQTHRNQLFHSRRYCETHGVVPADRIALALPPVGASARTDIFAALLSGATLCCRDLAKHGAEGIDDWVDREGITVLHLVPTLYRAMVRALPEGRVMRTVRVVRLGGEAIRRQDLESFARHFPSDAVLSWSLSTTESSASTMMHWRAGDPITEGPMPSGYPLDDPEPMIVDERGERAPQGATGRIVLRGTSLSPGYWKAPEIAAKFFADDPREPGVRTFATGDLGRIDARGMLVHEGRMDYHLKIAGNRIDPAELEEALCRHPDVEDAAVIPREATSGESWLHAYATTRGEVAASALRAHVASLLPPYMVPARIEFLEKMPLTATGKIDRAGLKARPVVAAAAEVDAPHEPVDHFEAGLCALWRELLEKPDLDSDSGFFENGGTSLEAVRLVEEVRRRFGAELPAQALFETPTPRALAEHLRGGAKASRWRHLAGVSTRGDARPFFCVPPGGRTAFSFEPLARAMGGERPFYTFHPMGALPGERPHETIEETAEAYVREMREVQPKGPYMIGGRCGGGLVAYEMARLLEEAGEKVAFVLLLDMMRVPHPASRALRLRYAAELILRIPFHRHRRKLCRAVAKRAAAKVGISIFPGSRALGTGEDNTRFPVYPTERERALHAAHSRACRRYRTRPLRAPILMVSPAIGDKLIQHQRETAFRILSRTSFEKIDVPGDHFSIMQGEALRRVADVIVAHCRRFD